jgi:hypothetical protein
LFDDGLTRFGLTQLGNRDGVLYQGGALDLASLVPMFFACAVTEGNMDPLPSLQMSLSISGATPVIEGLASSVCAGAPATFAVTARDQTGTVLTGYTQTVRFTSTDPGAILPAPFAFSPQDNGTSTFMATFATPGDQRLTVLDAETPVIASSRSISVTGVDGGQDAGTWDAGVGWMAYRVGCGGCGGAPDEGNLFTLLGVAACLRPRKRSRQVRG